MRAIEIIYALSLVLLILSVIVAFIGDSLLIESLHSISIVMLIIGLPGFLITVTLDVLIPILRSNKNGK